MTCALYLLVAFLVFTVLYYLRSRCEALPARLQEAHLGKMLPYTDMWGLWLMLSLGWPIFVPLHLVLLVMSAWAKVLSDIAGK